MQIKSIYCYVKKLKIVLMQIVRFNSIFQFRKFLEKIQIGFWSDLQKLQVTSEVDVMITIFSEKMAFFFNANDMIFLHKQSVFWVKNANFRAEFFRRKYF
jgi:hypothetical protein